MVLLVSSFGVIGWYVYRAIDPWAGPMREVRQLQHNGPRFYKVNDKSTRLYNLTKQAFFATKKEHSSEAREAIRLGRDLDPRNPVFDYLEASLLWAEGDRKGALKEMDSGNTGGVLRAYSTDQTSPDRWQWPEIDQIKNVGTEIAEDPNSSKAELISVLRLGHKIVWSEPSDFRRLLQGAALRKHAAERLLPIAKEEGNRRLEKLCEELIQENAALRTAAKRRLAKDDPFLAGSRAWIVSRALDKHDPEFRYAAMLLIREKQAEWGIEFRKKYLRIESLRNL